MYIRTCVDRLVLVALSAQPPGVNELCVCVASSSGRRLALDFFPVCAISNYPYQIPHPSRSDATLDRNRILPSSFFASPSTEV
jgi:hypothetical protein